MRAPSRTVHRLQAAVAILGTVSAVYGMSRLMKPAKVESRTFPVPVATEGAPIVPRVDPPPQQPQETPAQYTNPEFVQAASEGDVARMSKLYEEGMRIDGALTAAAENDHKEAVEWLIKHGADVNEGGNLLVMVDEYPDVTKVLLANGANEPTITDAASGGAKNAVNRIFAKNPKLDVNAEIDGTLPIDAAISGGHEEIVRAIVARGAKVTGAQVVSAMNGGETKLVDAVLAAPIDAHELSKVFDEASGDFGAGVVKKLAAKGAAWSWRDEQGDQHVPLVEAIDRQDFAVVKAMIDAGAPVNGATEFGRSPLAAALQIGATDDAVRLVRVLLDHGADANKRLDTAERPLTRAATNGDIRIVTLLLDHGARVNDGLYADDDETALEAAETGGQSDIARVLRARGAKKRRVVDQ